MKIIWLITALFISSFSFPSIAEEQLKPINNLTFLISRYFPNSPFFKGLNSGLVRLKNEDITQNFKIISYNANPIELKNKFNKALIDSSAIIMDYVDGADISYYVKKASEKDIPLVFAFTKPPIQLLLDHKNVFYITEDDMQSGIQQGLILSHYLKDHPEVDKDNNKVINIINIAGTGYKAPDEATRFLWQLNTINNYPNSQYRTREIANYPANYDAQKAYDYIKDLIAKNALNNVEVIITQGDQMALGVSKALQEAGNHTIPIIARNDTPTLRKMIAQGSSVIGTVASSSSDVSYYAGKIIYNYINKLNINSHIPYQIYKRSLELPFHSITRNVGNGFSK